MKSTAILPAVVEPTLEEQITALKATVNRLLDERAAAMKQRDDACAIADIHTARANNLIAELRQANAERWQLARANENQTRQLEQVRNELTQARAQLDRRERWRWTWPQHGNRL